MPFDGPDGYSVACDEWARVWRPRAPLSVSEWAEKHRRLSSKTSAESGRWRNSRIPFLRGIMDALSSDHPAPHVVFMKSSQVGGSECGLNWLGWGIHQKPAPILVLFPTEKLGKKWVRGRFQPMVAESPELRELIPLGRKSDGGNTLEEKDFPDGKLYIGSAGTPNDLSSVSVERLLLEEVDRFPFEIENEGDPGELADARLATFARAKKFELSTPTIESLSRINNSWQRSSKNRYFVPCPFCRAFQYLKWGNLRWPEGKPEEAAYVCEVCGEDIQEHHKTTMLEQGEWRAEHPERSSEIEGFHANCLMTPIGLGYSWARNARAFDRVRHDPPKLKAFTNTRLGETHADPKEKLEWETLKGRAEPWALRTIPRGYLVLTAGVDVQRNRLEVQINGWAPGERTAVIDYVVIYGDTTRLEDSHDEHGNVIRSCWDRLDDLLALPIRNSAGVDMRITATAIDSGYLQHEVMNFTRERRGRNIFATKGVATIGRQLLGAPKHFDLNFRGKTYKRGAVQYLLGTSSAKDSLYERLRADAKALPTERHVRFPDGLRDDYYRGVAAEVFDPVKRLWVKIFERNEPLDLFVLNMGAATHEAVQVNRMRAADWQRLAEMYEPQAGAAAPAAEVLGVDAVRTRTGFLPTFAPTVKMKTDE